LCGKGFGIGGTHAARGTGYQDVFAFQAIGVHGFLPK
jgi:hypothetical protein